MQKISLCKTCLSELNHSNKVTVRTVLQFLCMNLLSCDFFTCNEKLFKYCVMLLTRLSYIY